MRALLVVNLTPDIKRPLRIVQIDEELALQDFPFQAAVEALQLSLGLRVIRSGVADLDALAHQPDLQCGINTCLITPWRTVVHRHA
ncbi:hypothetical protein D3C74_437810 [compost metagenome]